MVQFDPLGGLFNLQPPAGPSISSGHEDSRQASKKIESWVWFGILVSQRPSIQPAWERGSKLVREAIPFQMFTSHPLLSPL